MEGTDQPAYRAFLTRYAELRRARRSATALLTAIFGLLVLISVISTGFYPDKLAAGVPNIGEYFGKLFSIVPQRGAEPVPVLSFAHLFGGVKQPQSMAYWFYRFGTYAAAAVADHSNGDSGNGDGFHRCLCAVASCGSEPGRT